MFRCARMDDDYYLLSTNEKNEKYCQYKHNNEEIKYCKEANVITKYINITYNCNKCLNNYYPYYSKFFERKICQSIFDKQITEINITKEKYNNTEYIELNDEYNKEIKNFFTIDGKKFYQCNNKDVGMQGCKGACNFSLKRKDSLKCEEECETGYIEIKEGICELCEIINPGCYQCHYENNYPNIYDKINRERSFVCDFCEEGLVLVDGRCTEQKLCDYSNLNYCEEYEVNRNNNRDNDEIYSYGFYTRVIDEYEDRLNYGFIKNNKYFYCNDVKNGGIENCEYCERNEQNKLICQICESGYILLMNNNSCLNIAENKELLENYEFCEKLEIDINNQLYCRRCKKGYSLLKKK